MSRRRPFSLRRNLSRFRAWLESLEDNHYIRVNIRARKRALKIIPVDATGDEIMRAWEQARCRQVGMKGIRDSEVASPNLSTYSLRYPVRRAVQWAHRVLDAVFDF